MAVTTKEYNKPIGAEIKMLRDLVLIKIEEVKEESDIELPDAVKESRRLSATSGEVVAVGPLCKVEIEDRVKYPAYIGNEIVDEELGDGIYVVVAESDIMMAFR